MERWWKISLMEDFWMTLIIHLLEQAESIRRLILTVECLFSLITWVNSHQNLSRRGHSFVCRQLLKPVMTIRSMLIGVYARRVANCNNDSIERSCATTTMTTRREQTATRPTLVLALEGGRCHTTRAELPVCPRPLLRTRRTCSPLVACPAPELYRLLGCPRCQGGM